MYDYLEINEFQEFIYSRSTNNIYGKYKNKY